MDTETAYASLSATVAVLAVLVAWVTLGVLRATGTAPALDGQDHTHHPLTLVELLWMLGLMLAFYWFGMQLGYLLLNIG
jgi:hypothetical protein